jgi:hypothetical protein
VTKLSNVRDRLTCRDEHPARQTFKEDAAGCEPMTTAKHVSFQLETAAEI